MSWLQQGRHAVVGRVLAHVEADELVFAAEEVFGECLGELGLADAGGADEEEYAERTCGVVEFRLEERDDVGDGADGLFLADDALIEVGADLGLIERDGVGDEALRQAGEAREGGADDVRRDEHVGAGDARGFGGFRFGAIRRGFVQQEGRFARECLVRLEAARQLEGALDGVRLDAHFVAALEVARDGVEDAARRLGGWLFDRTMVKSFISDWSSASARAPKVSAL